MGIEPVGAADPMTKPSRILSMKGDLMRRIRPWLPSKCRAQSPSHQQKDLVARQSSRRFKIYASCQIRKMASCFGGKILALC
jgi:hypothetical protein